VVVPPQLKIPDILYNQYRQIADSDVFPVLRELDGAMHISALQPDGYNFEIIARTNLRSGTRYFESLKVGIWPRRQGEQGLGRIWLFSTQRSREADGWRQMTLPNKAGGSIVGQGRLVSSSGNPGDMILFEDLRQPSESKRRYTWLLTLKPSNQSFMVPFSDSLLHFQRGASQAKSPHGSLFYPVTSRRLYLFPGEVRQESAVITHRRQSVALRLQYRSVPGVKASASGRSLIGHVQPLSLVVDAKDLNLQPRLHVYVGNRRVFDQKVDLGQSVSLRAVENKYGQNFDLTSEYQLQVVLELAGEKFAVFRSWQGEQPAEDPVPHGSSLPY
jgi:hypothetical protein